MAPRFELQPTLRGETLILRPMTPADREEMFAAASDPLIWEVHPVPDRWKRPVFDEYFDGGLASGGAFAVLDAATGRIVGGSRYYDLAEGESVAIGFTFLVRALWGGARNREMKTLMLDHAFRFVPRVLFHVGERNVRSQRAMAKIGGVRDGSREKLDRAGRVQVDWIYRIDRR